MLEAWPDIHAISGIIRGIQDKIKAAIARTGCGSKARYQA
jgi:hypothetical protein